MELVYPNKKSFQEIETSILSIEFDEVLSADFNYLIQGENLSVLKALIPYYARKIDLIYIDPPFATNNVFKIGEDRTSTISHHQNDEIAYRDTLKGADFLEFLRERLYIAKSLLSEKGSIYLHIDYKIGHYVKLIMDEVFGIDNFRNDITRIKCNPKNFNRNAYGNVKDMILFYSKSSHPIWNHPVSDYTEADIQKLFKKVSSNGRRYTTIPLHAPGETKKGSTSTEFKGLKPPSGRHWRCSPVELEALDKKGLIEWSGNGIPRKIIYADEKEGKKMQDIWEFKDPQYPQYPTEKNIELLKTIIQASSNEGSWVLDFFCGSGTTLVAAQTLGRKWIGIDQSEKAIAVVNERLAHLNLNLFSNAFKQVKTYLLEETQIVQQKSS